MDQTLEPLPNVGTLLERCGSVPSVPRLVAHLLHELQQPAPDVARIKRFVQADPGLTCRVLQLANAAGSAAPGRVAGTSQGIDLIGLQGLHVLGRAVAEGASFVAVPGMQMSQFWRVSLNTAKVARSLAGRVKVDPVLAFTAGMIHAVGEVFMQTCMPYEMGVLNKRVPPFRFGRARAEEPVFGYSYATVGAAFAAKWRFPLPLQTALRHMPHPYVKDDYEPLVGVLHLAAWRARAFEARYTPAKYAVAFPYEVGLALGLDIDVVLRQEPTDWRASSDGADD